MEIPNYRYNIQQARRKRTLIKRLLASGLALLIFGTVGLYSYAALRKSLPVVTFSAKPPLALGAEAVNLPWPTQGQAAIGTSDSGVLAVSSADAASVPIASVAKVITALAVMRQKPFAAGQPGGTLKLDDQDVSFYNEYIAKGGSVTPVNFGQELSEYDAMQALLLPSSNNMADSLVKWAFGSMDAYKAYANAMLKDYGLTHSSVDDASGFSPQTVSTASELVILGRKLLGNDVLASIVAKRETTIPIAGTIQNVNRLLADPSVIGIKTGNTDEAGGCLLFAAKHTVDANHEVTIIGAIAGSASITAVFTESAALLQAVKVGFGVREIVKAGTVVGTYTSAWGGVSDVVASETLQDYGWKGSDIKLEINPDTLNSPKKSGQEVGQLKTLSNNYTLSVPLKLKANLPAPSISWRLSHYF